MPDPAAMMSSGPFNLLEQICTHPQLQRALVLLGSRVGFAGSLVERLVEILTSQKKKTSSFQTLRERAAKIIAALVQEGGAGAGPALRKHAAALAEALKPYKANPAVAAAMATLAGGGPISTEVAGVGSKTKACAMCGTEGKMRKCAKCKEVCVPYCLQY
jgi:hypothetical protein